MTLPHLTFARRVRATPFERRVLEAGGKGFTVYNHMTLPSYFESLEADYAHLCEYVQLWDVACERQVELKGPDALQLAELTTPRDLSIIEIGQGRYAPLVDSLGGLINDPIVLRIAEDRYWMSIADSDVLLWLKGLCAGRAFDCELFEPDVSPLAVQGPLADKVMDDVLGKDLRSLPFFGFIQTTLVNTPVLIARSGYSGQGGYEIYLQDSSKGEELWDLLMEAGQPHNIRAGCPNLIERIEAGLLSYGNDMTMENNPYEVGLDKFFKLDKKAEYLGRDALKRIERKGVSQKLVKLLVDTGGPMQMRSTSTLFTKNGDCCGYVTSLAHSTKYGAALALAFLYRPWLDQEDEFFVQSDDGQQFSAVLSDHNWQPIRAGA